MLLDMTYERLYNIFRPVASVSWTRIISNVIAAEITETRIMHYRHRAESGLPAPGS